MPQPRSGTRRMGGGTETGGLGDVQRRARNRRASDKGLKSRAAHGLHGLACHGSSGRLTNTWNTLNGEISSIIKRPGMSAQHSVE